PSVRGIRCIGAVLNEATRWNRQVHFQEGRGGPAPSFHYVPEEDGVPNTFAALAPGSKSSAPREAARRARRTARVLLRPHAIKNITRAACRGPAGRRGPDLAPAQPPDLGRRIS